MRGREERGGRGQEGREKKGREGKERPYAPVANSWLRHCLTHRGLKRPTLVFSMT